MEEQVKILQQLGLTEYQAKVYAALLSKSESTADEITKISQVPITKIYSVLKSLEDMGFLKCTLTRPKYYRPVAVDGVVDAMINKRQEKIHELVQNKNVMISKLVGLYENSGKEHETPKDVAWITSGMEAGLIEIGKMVAETKERLCFLSTPEDCKMGSSDVGLMSLWMDLVLNKGIEIREIQPHMKKEDVFNVYNELGKNFNTKNERIRFYRDSIEYFKKYNIIDITNKDIHFTMIIRDSDVACVFLKQPYSSNDRILLMIYDKAVITGLLDYFDTFWSQATSIRDVCIDALKDIIKRER